MQLIQEQQNAQEALNRIFGCMPNNRGKAAAAKREAGLRAQRDEYRAKQCEQITICRDKGLTIREMSEVVGIQMSHARKLAKRYNISFVNANEIQSNRKLGEEA